MKAPNPNNSPLPEQVMAAIKKAAIKETAYWRNKGKWNEQEYINEARKKRWISVYFNYGKINIEWQGREKERSRFLGPYLSHIAEEAPDISGVFAISAGDGVRGNKDYPLLGYSALNSDRYAILIPDLYFIKGHIDLRTTIEANLRRSSWAEKTSGLIWRGAPTGLAFTENNWRDNLRIKLCLYSLNNPQIVGAKLSSYAQTDEGSLQQMLAAGLTRNYLSIDEQLCFKYLANVDGNSASWGGAFWKLASDSLMIQIEDESNTSNRSVGFRQWYHHWWEPDKQFLRCRLSNLKETVQWALNNDQQCQNMAKNATDFTNLYLTDKAGRAYMIEVLRALQDI